jgi:uncharacterized protein (DUF736 family)
MSEFKELGALWERTSKNGNFFFSGRVKIDGKETEIICFKNNKQQPKHPDWKVYLSEPRAGSNTSRPGITGKTLAEDDIPF